MTKKFSEKRLYNLSKELIVTSLKLLRKLSDCEDVPQKKVFFLHNGNISSKNQADFLEFAYQYSKEIRKLKEYKRLLNYLIEITSDKKSFANIANYSIPQILSNYILTYNSLSFRTRYFNNIFKRFVHYIKNEPKKYTIIVPLYNFKISLKETILIKAKQFKFVDTYTILRKIKEKELNMLLQNEEYARKFINSEKFEYIITFTYSLELNNGYYFIDHPALQKYVDSFILALRLFNEGFLGYAGYFAIPDNSFDGGNLNSSKYDSFHPIHPVVVGKAEYSISTLNKSERLISYRNIMERIMRVKRTDRADIIFDWYTLGYEAEHIFNRLICYFIVLESMLLNDNRELNYRLSLYVSALTGRDDEEREEIKKLITNGYAYRSKIVHGSFKGWENKQKKEAFLTNIASIENLLRETIIKYLILMSTLNKDEIIKLLDKSLLQKEKDKQLRKLLK